MTQLSMTQAPPDQTTNNPEPRLLLHVLSKNANETWMSINLTKQKGGEERTKPKLKEQPP